MELPPGPSLEELLASKGRLSLTRSLDLVREVAGEPSPVQVEVISFGEESLELSLRLRVDPRALGGQVIANQARGESDDLPEAQASFLAVRRDWAAKPSVSPPWI